MQKKIAIGDSNWEACVEALSQCREPSLLFGGQAVNWYADKYKGRSEELQNMEREMPFVSKDLDVIAGDGRQLLAELRDKGQVNAPDGAIWHLGTVRPKGLEDGVEPLDVFADIKGLENQDTNQLLKQGVQVRGAMRVLDPAHQLVAKAVNCVSIPQTNRQDGRHLKMMCEVVREHQKGLIADANELAADGVTPDRQIKKLKEGAEVILAGADNPQTAKVIRSALSRIFPLEELEACKSQEIADFAKTKIRPAVERAEAKKQMEADKDRGRMPPVSTKSSGYER